jgi:integrase
VNQDLRAARTVLGYLADADLLAHVSHDDLRRALKRLPMVLERPDYLKGEELRALIEAALKHDEERFTETRTEHAGHVPPGSTARYHAIAPFVATMVLTGLRVGHAVELDWAGVGDHEIAPGGGSATKRPGIVDLEFVPALAELLQEMRPKNVRAGRVFRQLTAHGVDAALLRLVQRYGAPAGTTWQKLRRTCGCFLTNAPGIFGGASAYRSAAWLGHSMQVAEKHYIGVVRGIPREARTLEAAMGIEEVVQRVNESARARSIGAQPVFVKSA